MSKGNTQFLIVAAIMCGVFPPVGFLMLLGIGAELFGPNK